VLDSDEYDSRPTNATPPLGMVRGQSRAASGKRPNTTASASSPCRVLDKFGNLIYNYASMQTVPTPSLFTELCRPLEYLPETDTMFLSGYTADPSARGRRVGDRRDRDRPLRQLEQGRSHPRNACHSALRRPEGLEKFIKAFAVAGDYLFAGEGREPCAIYVYNAKTGAPVGKLQPDATVGPTAAGSTSLRRPRFRRSTGEYLIFVEEDLDAKVILYRWKP